MKRLPLNDTADMFYHHLSVGDIILGILACLCNVLMRVGAAAAGELFAFAFLYVRRLGAIFILSDMLYASVLRLFHSVVRTHQVVTMKVSSGTMEFGQKTS